MKFSERFFSMVKYEEVNSDCRKVFTGTWKDLLVYRDGNIKGEGIFLCKNNADRERDDDFVVRGKNTIQAWLLHGLVWNDDEDAIFSGTDLETESSIRLKAFFLTMKNEDKTEKLYAKMFKNVDLRRLVYFPLKVDFVFNLFLGDVQQVLDTEVQYPAKTDLSIYNEMESLRSLKADANAGRLKLDALTEEKVAQAMPRVFELEKMIDSSIAYEHYLENLCNRFYSINTDTYVNNNKWTWC